MAIPELDRPCATCQTGQAQAERKKAYRDWRKEAADAYEAAAQASGITREDWMESAEGKALAARRPDPPEGGCVDCGWSTRQLTADGRELLKFVRFWAQVKGVRLADSSDPDAETSPGKK